MGTSSIPPGLGPGFSLSHFVVFCRTISRVFSIVRKLREYVCVTIARQWTCAGSNRPHPLQLHHSLSKRTLERLLNSVLYSAAWLAIIAPSIPLQTHSEHSAPARRRSFRMGSSGHAQASSGRQL